MSPGLLQRNLKTMTTRNKNTRDRLYCQKIKAKEYVEMFGQRVFLLRDKKDHVELFNKSIEDLGNRYLDKKESPFTFDLSRQDADHYITIWSVHWQQEQNNILRDKTKIEYNKREAHVEESRPSWNATTINIFCNPLYSNWAIGIDGSTV